MVSYNGPMGKTEKLLTKLLNLRGSFTFSELSTLLARLDYQISQGGKTSGSAVAFLHPERDAITLHRPHPSNELKPYQKKEIIEKLKNSGLI